MQKIDGQTRITGIFGYPVRHTLSPSMQNAAFDALGVNNVYVPFEVSPLDLRQAVCSLRYLNILGVNITIPHKEKILPFLDKVTVEAKKIGAVNLVCNISGVLVGDNTDWKGFLKDLTEDSGYAVKGKNCLVVGAGGAACAVIHALKTQGAKTVFVTDIIKSKAFELAKRLGAEPVTANNIAKVIKNCGLIVNATPVGMKINDMSFPFETALLDKKKHFVYDIVYNRETPLIKFCKKNGIKCSGGLGMLLYQGTETFTILTGKPAPVKLMRVKLLEAIRHSV